MKATHSTKGNTLFLVQTAIIAALYVMLTLLSALLGLDGKGMFQIRISEALCVLPLYTPATLPGVTVGCFIYNIFFANPIDAVFGTLATLIGVTVTYFVPLFKKHIFLSGLPTVISNTLIIPFIIAFVYTKSGISAIPFLMFTVFLGEFISCSLIGTFLAFTLKKHKNLFK